MQEPAYTWETSVRDYELDSQGIVNNAAYLHYFEQCRNDYIRSLGIDFYEYHHAGYDLVVAAIEIQYWRPLRINNAFYVTATIDGYSEKRVHFSQEIRRKKDNRLVAKAQVHAACVDQKTGKSCMPDLLTAKLPLQNVEAVAEKTC